MSLSAAKKRDILICCIVALLILCAMAARILGSPKGAPGLSSVIRNGIYMGLTAAWGVSVQRRIIQAQTRRYLIAIALLMLLWLTERAIKYEFNLSAASARRLWYSYYIPILLIPLITVFTAMSLGRPENYKLPGWTRLLYIPTFAFMAMVLTNDRHQLVFAFPADAEIWTGGNAAHSIGYFAVVAWTAVCAAGTIIVMIEKCRRPKSRIQWLPILPVALSFVYTALYVSDVKWLRLIAGDMTVFQCLAIMAALEGCIRCGLIQSNTGYDELSLSSLSTSDHSRLEDILDNLNSWAESDHVSLSLPSLRVDNFSKELMDKVSRLKKSGLTFAPEAGTQRLRDVINKNVTEEELMKTCRTAFEGGYTSVKLYFMMGLPTETLDDIKGIADTAQQVVDLFYKIPNRPKGKGVQVTISVACFVPKPDTPFQFCAQDRRESLREKQKYLLSCVHSRKIKVNYHDSTTSVLEGVFAKGDRRLGRVIETAFENGAFFDTWEEYFNYDRWLDAFKTCGLDPDFYNYRTIGLDEVTPWDHLDVGVTKAHLVREYNKALEAKTTQPCNRQCSACGANKLIGGPCFDYSKNLL